MRLTCPNGDGSIGPFYAKGVEEAASSDKCWRCETRDGINPMAQIEDPTHELMKLCPPCELALNDGSLTRIGEVRLK